MNMINIILILLILISLHYLIKKKENNNNNNNEMILNESFLNNPNAEYCDFDYDDINFDYEINPKIINNNNKNINKINYNIIKSLQPNIYYDNQTKQNKKFNDNDKLLENSIIYTKDNDDNNYNKTIREIYDDKIIDYKKDIPNKKKNNNNIIECGSNLHILSPNDWNYDNEKPENGGEIKDGLYAYDDLINDGVALC